MQFFLPLEMYVDPPFLLSTSSSFFARLLFLLRHAYVDPWRVGWHLIRLLLRDGLEHLQVALHLVQGLVLHVDATLSFDDAIVQAADETICLELGSVHPHEAHLGSTLLLSHVDKLLKGVLEVGLIGIGLLLDHLHHGNVLHSQLKVVQLGHEVDNLLVS